MKKNTFLPPLGEKKKVIISHLREKNYRSVIAEELLQGVQFLRDFMESPLPESRSYRFALSQEPASTLGVGGDYLKVERLDENHIVFISGDVAGQGLRGAIISGLLHNLLEHNLIPLLKKNPQEPHRLLEWLNRECRLLFRKGPPLFLACGIGVLNEKDPTLYYAAAGVPPLFIHHGSEVQSIESHGTVMGVLPRRHYSSSTLSLYPGDAILCCSDGFYPTGHSPVDILNHQFGEFMKSSMSELLDHTAIIQEIETLYPRQDRDDRSLLTLVVQ